MVTSTAEENAARPYLFELEPDAESETAGDSQPPPQTLTTGLFRMLIYNIVTFLFLHVIVKD